MTKGALGILCLANQADRTGEPVRAIGNAATFRYPVVKKVVPGAWSKDVMRADPALLDAHIQCARELVDEGARAITAHCGYAIAYQDEVASAVHVPVCLSSLAQARFVLPMLGRGKKIAVICANTQLMTEQMLAKGGLSPYLDSVVVAGLDGTETFEVWTRPSYKTDWAMVERDTLAVVRRLLSREKNLGAIVVECTGLPPMTPAIQSETGLPTYDWITTCDYLAMGVGLA